MKRLILTASLVLAGGTSVTFAQTERFDIASFTPPQNWKRITQTGSVGFMTAAGTGASGGSCQIVIYPSGPSRGAPRMDLDAAWANIVTAALRSSAQPTVTSTKRPDGWELTSGAAIINHQGSAYTTMITTATGFGKTIPIQVTVMDSGNNCVSAVSAFFDSLKFDPQPARSGASVPAGDLAGIYDFTAPAGWSVRKMDGHLRLDAPGGSCLILIFPPQRSTGDLQRDASAVFDNMYPGWQAQKAGAQRYTLSKGILPGGQEFFLMEAGMRKPSSDGTRYDGFEDGAAFVIKAGAEIAVIAARHNTSLLGHSDCFKSYDRWRRFFNSFAVRNIPGQAGTNSPAARIIGRWSMSESGASGEYVFAANGNYALVGALGTASTSSDINYDYLHIKTYAFPGDGSYAISGTQLTLRRRGGSAEQVRIRFEQVNHGGVGWVDRIQMLKRDAQGETEVAYEKRGR
ncbi:MAG: hypothetical protein ABL984_08105 [Pyrinomonadaceae bacterium]